MPKKDIRRYNNTTSAQSTNLRMHGSEGKFSKEELRMSIIARRQARGESELTVEFHEPQVHELTEAEMEKKDRRREQNRRAAQRCRKKKRQNQMSVQKNFEWIITHNQQLRQEVQKLREEMAYLQSVLKNHQESCVCPAAPKISLPARVPKVKAEPDEGSLQAGGTGLPAYQVTSSPSRDAIQYAALTPESLYDGPDRTSGSSQSAYNQATSGFLAINCSSGSLYQPPTDLKVTALDRLYQSPTDLKVTALGSLYQPPTDLKVTALGSLYQPPTDLKVTALGSLYQQPPTDLKVTALSSHQQQFCVSSHAGAVYQGLLEGSNISGFTTPTSAFSSPSRGTLPDQKHLPHFGAGGFFEANLPDEQRLFMFQEEVVTPLSADGRHSISPVSSDISAASVNVVQAADREYQSDVVNTDVLLTDHMSMSNLLSYIMEGVADPELILNHN